MPTYPSPLFLMTVADVSLHHRQAGIKAKSKMSKAEKMRQKKDKAKNFNGAGAGAAPKKAQKNAKRWH